jgi:hypothetical protein
VANAKPARLVDEPKDEKKKPEIQYFGEGAEKVKFEVEPNATLIRVYANGMVLVDY